MTQASAQHFEQSRFAPAAIKRRETRVVLNYVERRTAAQTLRAATVLAVATKLAAMVAMSFEEATGFAGADEKSLQCLTTLCEVTEERVRRLKRRARADTAAIESVVIGQAIHSLAELTFSSLTGYAREEHLKGAERAFAEAAASLYLATFAGPNAAKAWSSLGSLLDDGEVEPCGVVGDDEPNVDDEHDDEHGDEDPDMEHDGTEAEDDDPHCLQLQPRASEARDLGNRRHDSMDWRPVGDQRSQHEQENAAPTIADKVAAAIAAGNGR